MVLLDVKQIVAAALTIGMLIMLLNLIGNGPLSPSTAEETALMAAVNEELVAEDVLPRDPTSKDLWGKPGPALHPCTNKSIKSRQGKTWGFVSVVLAGGPQFHAFQIVDAVIVSQYLGATLLLPTIKEGLREPNGDFDKLYDVNNFIASLSNVVRVVGRLPEETLTMTPPIIKVPCKVTPEYLEENVQAIFHKNGFIQLRVMISTSCMKSEDMTDDLKDLRCLVIYESLRFHSQVQKLGERVINRVREAAETSGGRFVSVYLYSDVLKQKGCIQEDETKVKKCFDAYEVAIFLQMLGFSSETAIYLTQSRWDPSLEPLKEIFPKVFTKEYSMPFNEEKQILYSGNTQFEKAIDFYICSHSDVFVPAISGMSYASISGMRIALGKTQIFVPSTVKEYSSKIQISKALSRFVTKKTHVVYYCHCDERTV